MSAAIFLVPEGCNVSRVGIRIGTSGWHYRHWVGPFYPEGTPAERFLPYYVDRFDTVELNNTFYQIPATATLSAWRDATPGRFLFTSKASRYITHMKKLKDPEQSLVRFMDAVETLERKLGPILFQLPPRWGVDPERLKAFLRALPPGNRYAFEFRDESWFHSRIYDLLTEHRAAFCIYDLAGRRAPAEVTTDFAYVRLHGPGSAYQGSYDGRTLDGWARRFLHWRDRGITVFCYFDNDQKGYAALDALRLTEMIRRRPHGAR